MREHHFAQVLSQLPLMRFKGKVSALKPGRIESAGPKVAIGDLCSTFSSEGRGLASVVSVDGKNAVLIPILADHALSIGDEVELLSELYSQARVGDGLSGRVINGLAEPVDEKPGPLGLLPWPLSGRFVSPLSRSTEMERLETGIRSIDACLPLAKGQRTGIFAASGVGKTTLIEQLVRHISADRIVLCLVGERGREVSRFWNLLTATGKQDRTTIVASTSDESAPMRARAVQQALAASEYWRDRGEHVVLFVDSITRYAMALREIGLAAGEPATVRAYTPNVFAQLPKVVERCGQISGKGSITAIFTVLSETDDIDDPIVEVMKSLLDGHIILSRTLADAGRYPAIDTTRSVSRLSDTVSTEKHIQNIHAFNEALSLLNSSNLLVDSGLYKSGQNPRLDRLLQHNDEIKAFFTQSTSEKCSGSEAISALSKLVRLLQ